MEYKKLNIGERSVTRSQTLTDSGALFSEETLTITETEGRCDRQLLEAICNKLNNMAIKQDENFTRVKKGENQVLGYETEFQDLKQTQS